MNKLIDDIFKDSDGCWDVSRILWVWGVVNVTGDAVILAFGHPVEFLNNFAAICAGFAAMLAAGGGAVLMHSNAPR